MKKYILITLLAMAFIYLSGRSEPPEEELLKKLEKCDVLEIEAAVEWCGILRIKKAAPLLEQLLEKDNNIVYWHTRLEIIKALGKIGDPSSIGILLRCLPSEYAISALNRIDPYWQCRQESTEYYAQQMEAFHKNFPNADNRDIIDTFESLLALDCDKQQAKNLCLEILTKKESDKGFSWVIAEAVSVLVQAKAVEAIEPLLERVENLSGNYIHLYVEALESLFPAWHESPRGKAIEEQVIREFKKIKAGIQRPVLKLDNPAEKKYTNMINLLKWFPSGVPLLSEIARDQQESFNIRYSAAEALGDIAKPGDTHILGVLIELLKQENDAISLTALEELNRIGERCNGTAPAKPEAPEITRRLVDLLENNHRSDFPIEQILYGLLIWGDEQVAPILLNMLKKKPKEDLYTYTQNSFFILNKLIEIGHPEAFGKVVRLYKKAGEDSKRYCIKLLGTLKDPRALPLLRKALTDKDRRVRAYAEWAIYHITKE